MDRESIIAIIKNTPSPVIKLVMEGRNSPFFILDGVVESITTDAVIFRSRTQTSAVSFSKIIEIVLTDRRIL